MKLPPFPLIFISRKLEKVPSFIRVEHIWKRERSVKCLHVVFMNTEHYSAVPCVGTGNLKRSKGDAHIRNRTPFSMDTNKL